MLPSHMFYVPAAAWPDGRNHPQSTQDKNVAPCNNNKDFKGTKTCLTKVATEERNILNVGPGPRFSPSQAPLKYSGSFNKGPPTVV